MDAAERRDRSPVARAGRAACATHREGEEREARRGAHGSRAEPVVITPTRQRAAERRGAVVRGRESAPEGARGEREARTDPAVSRKLNRRSP